MTPLLNVNKNKDVILVHTLTNRSIKVPSGNVRTVSDLKNSLCRTSCVLPDEVSVITQGICLDNDCDINVYASKPLYVIVKGYANRKVPIQVRLSGSSHVSTILFSLNAKVAFLKNVAIKEKVCNIETCNQKAILGGQVMKESSIIGDYLLHVRWKKLRGYVCTVVLSESINPKREIDVILQMPNFRDIKFSFPCGEALYYAKIILLKQFGVPNDIPYSFKHNSGCVLKDHNSLMDYNIVSNTTTKVSLQFLGPKSPLISTLVGLLGECEDNILFSSEEGISQSPQLSSCNVDDNKHRDTSLFSSMKKGFLSSAKSSSSLTIKYPAAAGAKKITNSKDIWSYDEIPTEGELIAKSQMLCDGDAVRKKCKSEHPIRYVGRCHNDIQSVRMSYSCQIKEKTGGKGKKPSQTYHKEVLTDEISVKTENTGSAPSILKNIIEPKFSIRFQREVGTVVKVFSAEDCTHIIIKIHFPQSKMKDLDLDVTSNKVKAASKYHCLKTLLPVTVAHRLAKAKFNSKKEILTIILPIISDSR